MQICRPTDNHLEFIAQESGDGWDVCVTTGTPLVRHLGSCHAIVYIFLDHNSSEILCVVVEFIIVPISTSFHTSKTFNCRHFYYNAVIFFTL